MSPSLHLRHDEQCHADGIRRRRASGSELLAVLLLAVASSCEASPEVIRGEDRDVFAPRLRASLPLGDAGDDDPLELELEVANYAGDFTQTLEPFEFIQLDDLRIDGPGEVEAEFVLTTASLGLHQRIDTESRFSLGWAAGLEVSRLDIEVSSGALTESDLRHALGPRVAVELAFELREELEVFARHGVFLGSPDTYLTVLDLGAAWRALPSLGLIAGWHFTYLEESDDSDERSRIELRSSGPFVTLALSLPRRRHAGPP